MHIAQEIWSYYKYQTLLKATEFSVQMLRENAQEHIYRSLISHANHLVIKVC